MKTEKARANELLVNKRWVFYDTLVTPFLTFARDQKKKGKSSAVLAAEDSDENKCIFYMIHCLITYVS